jgi:hypothetical protein
MDPGFAAFWMITVVALLSGTAIKVVSLWSKRHHGPGSTELSDRVEAMEGELAALQRELAETQERLDFTERVMAQNAEMRRVAPPEG